MLAAGTAIMNIVECAGVLCLDLHSQHPNLLAVGCYDGSVHVFDIRQKVVTSSPGCTRLLCSIHPAGMQAAVVWLIPSRETDMQWHANVKAALLKSLQT